MRVLSLVIACAATSAAAVAHADYTTQEFNPRDAYPGTGHALGISGNDLALAFDGGLGEVRIYRQGVSGNYVHVQTLDGYDDAGWPNADVPPVFPEPSDSYGVSVATDDAWIFASDPAGNGGHGRVYVYHRSGNSWALAYLVDNPLWPGQPQYEFGWKMAVGGTTAVVSAGTRQFYVFRWLAVPSGGGFAFDWVVQALIELPRAADRVTSIAVDGDRIVVGSVPPSTFGVAPAAYVYERSGANWPLAATLTVGGLAAGDQFGHSVDIEGVILAVGAPRSGPGDDGMVHVFWRPSSGWTLLQSIGSPDIITNGDFGAAVAISGDYLAVGDPGRLPHGAALLYQFFWAGYLLTEELTPTTPRAGSHLGNVVDVNDDGVVFAGNLTEVYWGNAQVFWPAPDIGIIPP